MATNLSENALNILNKRYLKKDGKGKVIETPEEMFYRVAHHVALAEKIFSPQSDIKDLTNNFLNMMTSLNFLPNSPALMNAGRKLNQMAACFVLPVDDSLSSIFETLKNAALIHQSGGGTGFSFSELRPKNDLVSTTSGIASGPVSFLEVFNEATNVIKQGGTRRGANMAVLRVDHPDILEFITAKKDQNCLTSFNLSVGITNKFMDALENNKSFALINPRTGKSVTTIKAQTIFDIIVECAWETGEPGLLFLDHINEKNPTPLLGRIESTNPCGEQPLLPYEACTLGSINLTAMITDKVEVDWNKLEATVFRAVHFLDNIIEINQYPLTQIKQQSLANRKIGLGVMGFAHLLILLGISYGSEKAIQTASDIMSFIQKAGRKASQLLAQQRGSFSNFQGSIYDQKGLPPLRNATITTIAPTGSLSLIAGCSWGIEPIYSLYYTRRTLDSLDFSEFDPIFKSFAAEHKQAYPELLASVKKTGTIPDNIPLPLYIKNLFLTAFNIPPSQHVRIQAAFQNYTDNAVSKTINLPQAATRRDVAKAFSLAYELRCKGITVYRNGTRSGQILTCRSMQSC